MYAKRQLQPLESFLYDSWIFFRFICVSNNSKHAKHKNWIDSTRWGLFIWWVEALSGDLSLRLLAVQWADYFWLKNLEFSALVPPSTFSSAFSLQGFYYHFIKTLFLGGNLELLDNISTIKAENLTTNQPFTEKNTAWYAFDSSHFGLLFQSAKEEEAF